MKAYFTTTICLLLLFSFGSSFSQTTITNNDYEVSDDVVKIEEYQYKPTLLTDFTSTIYSTKDQEFKDGFIVKSAENHSINKIHNSTISLWDYDLSNKSYVVSFIRKTNNEIKENVKSENVLYGKKPLQFTFDKNEFQKITKSKNLVVVGEKSLELLENNKIKLTTSGIFEEENYWIYNIRGQNIEYNIEGIHRKLKYNSNGLLKKVLDISKSNEVVSCYYYETDKSGNWVKRIEISKEYNQGEQIRFSARKLTYKNGTVTGDTEYDKDFISKSLVKYMSENIATKYNNCISGDCQNGFGKMKFENGNIYEGNFKNGAFHGYGKVFDSNNVLAFEGNYENWIQNGKGKIYYKNGDIYQGNLNNGKLEGKGTFTFANGGMYKGGFVNGRRNGEGTFMTKNGDIYEGTYKNGQLNGKGSYIGKETKYIGDFSEGHFHGEGKFTDKDGITYVGTFIKGTLTGQASAFYKDKLVSQGKMKDFQFDGEVTFYDYTNKKKFVRLYKEGVLLKTISESSLEEANVKPAVNLNTLPNTGLYWKKNSENTEVWLYENGKELEGTVFFVDNTLYFYDVTHDDIYSIQNFKSEAANSYHNASKLPYKYPHGAWMRWDAQGGLQAVNAKGKIIRGNTIFKKAANNIDVIYKGKGETETLFFKGFHNANIKRVYPAELYEPYKVVKSNINSNKITWKKNEANSFWLYDNGVLKSGGKSFWQGNNLYVYMVDEASLYLLKNYKIETPNTTHQAELFLNKFPNGLWYKTSKGGAIVYNAKGLFIKTTEIYKYDTNGIDVLFKGKDEKETLFLKNFKNVSANVVFPTEIYNPTSTSTSTSTSTTTTPSTTTSNISVSGNSNGSSFQAEIDACKTAGVNCLANKITEKFTTLKNSGVSEAAIFTKLAADFNSIAAYNIKALFDMIFKLDTNILPKEKYGKILAKMSQEQRANLRTYSQKIIVDYKKTHN